MTVLRRSSKYIGAGVLLCIMACNGGTKSAESTVPATGNSNEQNVPNVISYDVVKEYPHDPLAFTEGLEYKDGVLYESTGEYGVSDIRKTNLTTGKVIVSHKMDKQYFGEGLTMLNGKLYQLTYKEGKGFVYDAGTLKEEKTFSFAAQEGWGMTNNGAQLIYDDGTNVLHYLDPVTFKEIKTLAVTDERGPVSYINELEMIHGFIYANIWQTDLIIKIDTATGRVVGRADLGSLRQRGNIPPMSGHRNAPDVLNGIAYDAAGNRIFVTGKDWPKVFEVKLDN